MDPLEKLYQNYNVLSDAKDDILKFENHYREIINATRGSSTEKRLASQFICKFYKDFPNLQELAVDSLFDLCEDEDVEIRKQVIKDLPSICKDHLDNVPKITDILCQLLDTVDPLEIQIIHLSLISLCKISPKLFLTGLFAQIENGEEVIKERAINFLHNKIKTLPEDFWSKENEEFFLNESKKILIDSSKERFTILMSILSNLKICKRISGQQVLLDIINQNIHLEEDLVPEDQDSLDNFLFYLKYANGCFSHYVCSNQYVDFICTKIVQRHQVITTEENELKENFNLLTILQIIAEISAYIQPTITTLKLDLVQCEKIIFTKLLTYLPEVNAELTNLPDFKLDYLEPLLFAFHNFGKKNEEQIINDIGGDEVLKEFKKRLQQLGLGCQERIKTLQTSIRSIKEVPSSPKAVALKCVQNIQAIIKDMFYLKPVFKVSLAPSWKFGSKTVVHLIKSPSATVPTEATSNGNSVKNEETTVQTNNKRKLITAPEKDPEDLKKAKIYTPPSGKFTNKNNFRNFNSGGSRFKQRGGMNRGGNRFRQNNRSSNRW